MINQLISSFNAGELSPYLDSRTTLDKYRNGCRTLENYLITPYGPANRRAGLEYLGAAKLSTSRCRLIGLNIADSNRVVLELGVGYMRFWKNGALLMNGASVVEAVAVNESGTVISPAPTATHPYTEADLRQVRICQVNNVVYLAHPSYAPLRLSRYSDTNWTIGPIPWSWPPMIDQNVSSTTITPSATTGTVTLTASSPLFAAGHVGSYWQLDHATDTSYLNQSITGNTTSSSLSILGKWQLQSFGTWNADVLLESSVDGGSSWEVRRSYVSRGDYNAVASGEETVTTLFRFRILNYSSNTNGRIQLSPIDPMARGYCKITAVTGSPTSGLYSTATATVSKAFGSATATSQWWEGAFSSVQGFPSALSLHDSRLIFAGTDNMPNMLWASYSNDFQNFRQGAYDADSWAFALATSTRGRIQWLVSKTSLLVGTALDEWSVAPSDTARGLTATNVSARLQSSYGSTSLPALVVNDTILYVQRMARKIRELVYTFSSESWVSNDITALAEHTTRKLILEVAYQRVPDAVVWFVRGDGQLVSVTYEREQQVVGFARHITDGTIESVATINGSDSEDEVYVAVNRTVNGQTVRYIERFRLGQREALDAGDKSSWFYVDAGVKQTPTYSGGVPVSYSTITGLGHLEGKSVAIWGGVYVAAQNAITYGVILPTIDTETNEPMKVTSGQITLQTAICAHALGLSYTSLLSPERVTADLSDGTSQGRKQRIPRLNVRVYQSFGGEYSPDKVNWFPMVARTLTNNMDDSPGLLNTWTRMFLSSNWSDGADIFLRQQLPVPLTVSAIVPVWEATEGQN